MLSDEHEFAFLTFFQAPTPDRVQYVMAFLRAAGPLQQQGTLNGWPKDQRRDDIRVLKRHCAIKIHIVEPFPAEEPQDHPHAERQAKQVWLVEALGLGDGLLGHFHACTGLIGVEQGIGQRDQDLHPKRAVEAHLTERALQQACTLEEAVSIQPHNSESVQRLCAHVAGRQLLDGLFEDGTRPLLVAGVEMV